MARQNKNTRRWDFTKIMSWITMLSCILAAVLPLPVLAGDVVFYYHNDTTGSPVAITNSAGTVVWQADYEPFGELAGVVETVPNNQQFLAKTVDPETSLHLLGARFYDGKLGRFLSVDPVLLKGQPSSAIQYPQRLNLYGYAGNNPYRHTDSSGRYLETAWDLVSLGLSLQSFHANPTVLNGLAVAYDTFALAVPILPAGAGIVMKGAGGLEKMIDVGGAVRGIDKGTEVAKEVNLSRSLHGEAAEHAADAIRSGKPDVLTIERSGAKANRETSIGGLDKVPGKHLDEFPPAMFKEGGKRASVRPINPRDNMSAGACVGNACRGLPDGSKVRITVGK